MALRKNNTNNKIDSIEGLLFNINHQKIYLLKPLKSEFLEVIIKRNYFLTNLFSHETRKELPPMIKTVSDCLTCHLSKTCSVYSLVSNNNQREIEDSVSEEFIEYFKIKGKIKSKKKYLKNNCKYRVVVFKIKSFYLLLFNIFLIT